MIKQSMIALGLLIMLVCSIFPVTANSNVPDVRLPTDIVKMRATNATDSWFDMYLFNVPPGYDITNNTSYNGWCVQSGVNMTRNVNHTVLLYSSCGSIPSNFSNINWNKENYIINHKQGGRLSIQRAIWHYSSSYPIPGNDTFANSMVNDADTNGQTFVPSPGQKIAILVDVVNGNYNVQRSFFELTLRMVELGDLVWNDYNHNGIQDAGEPGIKGVTIQLYNATDVMVESTVTDSSGFYSFINQESGNYSIQFVKPEGNYLFSPQHQGSDTTKDSDPDPTTGRTPIFEWNQSVNDTSWDAGIYHTYNNGSPVPPPSPPSNIVPTADGTAGEPYISLLGQEITFNGSRSYDHDGTIVSFHWSFGDGTSGNGSIVTHTYTAIGTYTVTLTVIDNDGAADTYTTSASVRGLDLPPLPPQITGPTEGHLNIQYSFYVVTTDPNSDDVLYTINWGDESQNVTPFYASGFSVHMAHEWTSYGFYQIQVSAKDVTNRTSNVTQLRVAIDVQYVGSLGYLINTDGIGPYDMFYSNETGTQTAVHQQAGGDYLIDTNGDGSYDQLYNTQSGALRAYPETLGSIYTFLLIGVVIAIVIIVIISIFLRRRSRT